MESFFSHNKDPVCIANAVSTKCATTQTAATRPFVLKRSVDPGSDTCLNGTGFRPRP